MPLSLKIKILTFLTGEQTTQNSLMTRIWSFVNGFFESLSTQAKDINSEVKEVNAIVELFIQILLS